MYHMKRTRAVTTIAKNVRRWSHRRRYILIRQAVIGIQKYGRAFLARQKYQNLKKHKAVSKV